LREIVNSGEGFDDYRILADAIPQIVWAADAKGALVYCNRAWFAYTGIAQDEAIAGGWSDVLHPDDVEGTFVRWKHSVETAEPYVNEYRFRGRDGEYRWFVARAEAVLDAGGAVVRWYGGCTDVNDLKVAEEALRDNATTYRNLANSLPQIVWITNAEGRNTFLNERWYDYTGVDPQSTHSLQAVTHPDDFAQAIEKWKHGLATGAAYETEYRLRRVDGVYRWFLGRAVPIRTPDEKIVQWFGSCTDIEDRKRAEAEIRTAYEREHRIATTLQRAFLTHDLPQVDGLRFDAVYRPAECEAEVGGDWYDAIELDDGRIVLSIGDVAGHGLDAAVVMGNVRQAIRVVAQVVQLDPVAMLDAIDRNLRCESPDTIVPAFIGIIDPAGATLSFASAGHPPPLLYADGAVVEVWARGLPLGLRDGGGGGALERIALPRSGTLVLYTDGLIESTRDIIEGERRLRAAIVAAARDAAPDTAAYIDHSVLHDGARDDVAVLAITFSRAHARSAGLDQQVA